MSFQLQESNAFTPEGAATIRTIDKIYSDLKAYASDAQSIEVDCKSLTEFDVSFAQLLLSAQTFARNTGRTMRLRSPLPDAALEMLRRGGFVEICGLPVGGAS